MFPGITCVVKLVGDWTSKGGVIKAGAGATSLMRFKMSQILGAAFLDAF